MVFRVDATCNKLRNEKNDPTFALQCTSFQSIATPRPFVVLHDVQRGHYFSVIGKYAFAAAPLGFHAIVDKVWDGFERAGVAEIEQTERGFS